MPQKRIIYLDHEWTKFGNSDDIITYYTAPAQSAKYELQIKTSTQLINMHSQKILNGIIFARTSIIQRHIHTEFSPEKAKIIIPNTYDREFAQFFGREINIITLDQLRDKYLANSESRFIKPLGNSKLFDGQVIDDFADLDKLLFDVPELSPTTRIYSSPVMDIEGEIRLLIGCGRLYGRGQISIADPPNQDYLAPHGFLDKLIRCVGNRFLCVDIGWVPEINSWVVIEINPPFSLENYDIPLADYLEFTEDTFKWIVEN